MPTNIRIEKTSRGEPLKRTTVTESLREYILGCRQAKIVELFGTIDYDPEYDYKKQRRLTTRRLADSSTS